jgi:8-oxo-dGTP diphosphatase
MTGRRHRALGRAYAVFGRLPRPLRRRLVRLSTPTYTVGALCAIVDGDDILLVRQSYRRHWGIPGGMLDRNERPADAAVREVGEEVGVRIDLDGPPAWILLPRLRRIDVAYRCRLAAEVDRSSVTASSPEILEARWFPLGALPAVHGDSVRALQELGLSRSPR